MVTRATSCAPDLSVPWYYRFAYYHGTSPAQNNGGIGRKTQNEFFRGLLAPWGFGEHPKTHTFLESTCPEVNETAIKISNFGRYPQFRRPSNFGDPPGAILTPTCARAWEARAGCVSMPPGGLWRGEWTQLAPPLRIFVLCFVLRM